MRNDGKGQFTDEPGADVTSAAPVACAVGDYDNDEKPDVGDGVGGGRLALFRNDGSGAFDAAAPLIIVKNGPGVVAHLGVSFVDVDHDADLDVVVTSADRISATSRERSARRSPVLLSQQRRRHVCRRHRRAWSRRLEHGRRHRQRPEQRPRHRPRAHRRRRSRPHQPARRRLQDARRLQAVRARRTRAAWSRSTSTRTGGWTWPSRIDGRPAVAVAQRRGQGLRAGDPARRPRSSAVSGSTAIDYDNDGWTRSCGRRLRTAERTAHCRCCATSTGRFEDASAAVGVGADRGAKSRSASSPATSTATTTAICCSPTARPAPVAPAQRRRQRQQRRPHRPAGPERQPQRHRHEGRGAGRHGVAEVRDRQRVRLPRSGLARDSRRHRQGDAGRRRAAALADRRRAGRSRAQGEHAARHHADRSPRQLVSGALLVERRALRVRRRRDRAGRRRPLGRAGHAQHLRTSTNW